MNLSEFIQNQNARVSALENVEFDDEMTIARIKKLYPGVRILQRIRVAKAQYKTCSTSLMCSTGLKNTISYEVRYF